MQPLPKLQLRVFHNFTNFEFDMSTYFLMEFWDAQFAPNDVESMISYLRSRKKIKIYPVSK